ncbi:DHH family phosphoesterase [Dellaglioa carnosa]|uniref:Bifunctional oligoribonuclease/PAP phosphatase NrnA n=1 Tax=Dellaglioa carnosa TaxID=2995136 RepID=A0ABT4JPE4_9LACO|nr:bifunctional oligoribonuclease/PAP phosphatase NrnA [Dellaglioa carnosa]MCZ2491856.1 bifunctional oligoribonuclease/PAP phosphatase NrnA [Dellaglioa carnosa]MCZ2494928.1 bifunctional oligoribonuclease/PAP phosphatase NrnA [Dellaglioa carnosa]MDK1731791.1 bifunctional oligoribonuclease/PAP phosphatase NrnA [Dellaglioa carnosa]
MKIELEILKKIKQFDTIIIHRHQSPDPDAIGSQSGLAAIIRASFPEKKVYQVGAPSAGLAWISDQDEIADDLYTDALVIVIDTANRPRIEDDRYTTGAYLIKFDHHPNEDVYGDLVWVKTGASSSSELVMDLVDQVEGGLTVTDDAARMLYAGIVGDTGRFMYSATTAHTMQVVAELMAYHFSTTKINQKMDNITAGVAKLSGYVYDNLVITEHKAAYVVLTHDYLDSIELGDAGSSQIVPLPGKIIEVQCWAIFVQQKDGSYRVRLRSKGPVINQLAKEHDGGGHPMASGARAKDQAEYEEIVKSLDDLARTYTGE